MFVSPISTRHQQGLTHVVSQPSYHGPALWRLRRASAVLRGARGLCCLAVVGDSHRGRVADRAIRRCHPRDRKSTRLNSSHGYISYAVFCLKKKKKKKIKFIKKKKTKQTTRKK